MTALSCDALLKASIKSIPDYPKPGIIFRDVTSLMENGEAFACAIDDPLSVVMVCPSTSFESCSSRYWAKPLKTGCWAEPPFDGLRVLPDAAARPDPPPFFAQVVGCPHSVVTAHLVDAQGEPTIAARDEILAFFRHRLQGVDHVA